MKKKHFFILPFLLFILYGCPSPYGYPEVISTKTAQLTSNIIGVTGEESDEPYVEVEYTMVENGVNITKSEMLTPPFYIGGNKVIVHYDSVVFKFSNSNKPLSISREIKPDFSKSGSYYLKIINHSDKPIEYFVAGTQPMVFERDFKIKGVKTPDGYDIKRFIASAPSPIYKDAPIYYLLFPEKRPNKDVFIERVTKFSYQKNGIAIEDVVAKRIKFEGDNCGDLKVNPAWSIDQVMDLYRKEYARDTETPMFINYNHADPVNDKRLSDVIIEHKVVYGKVASRETLQNRGQIWLLNTSFISLGSEEF